MSERVWVISELYYPEETSTGYFLTQIAEGLAQHYQVNVLCSQPTYAARGTRAPTRERRHGVDIRRCPATTLNKDVLLFRLVNLVTISLSIFWAAITHIGSRDVVLVVTNPPLLPFGIALACWLRGAKCLLLIHDVYPEVLVATGLINQRSVLAHGLSWLTQRLYHSMERIIVLGRDMRALVARKMGGVCHSIIIIPNWADVNEIIPLPRSQNGLLQELGLAQKFIIQYSGNMGRTHGVESLLACAHQLSHQPDVHFLFIGAGAKKNWLDKTVQRDDLRNVTVLPTRPRNDLASSLNACDVAIISFMAGTAGISVPSRMYNILAAGKPIVAVADDDSELALVVREAQIGWVVPPGQTNRIVEAILEARANQKRLIEMGWRARAVAEQNYSFERIIQAYCDLIRSLDHESQS